MSECTTFYKIFTEQVFKPACRSGIMMDVDNCCFLSCSRNNYDEACRIGNGGSVFIFRGGPNGIDEKPSQVIKGSQVDSSLRGFGYSLSGQVDLDSNGYPDILVGAPDSGQTVYFR